MCLGLVLLALVLPLMVQAQPAGRTKDPVILANTPQDVMAHAQVLRDSGARLDILDVLDLIDSGSDGFQTLPEGFSAGFTRDAFWIRFALASAAGEPSGTAWLEVHPPWLQDVRLYTRTPDGGIQESRAGTSVPMSQRFLQHPSTVFPVVLSEEPRTVIMRVTTSQAMVVNIRLMTPETFAEVSALSQLRSGFLFGCLMMGSIVALMGAWWVRQSFFTMATAYLASHALLYWGLYGLDQVWFYPDQPWLNAKLIASTISLVGAMLGYLTLSYLDPERHFPLLTHLVQAFSFTYLMIAILCLLDLHPYLFMYTRLLGLVLCPLLIMLAIGMLRHSRERGAIMIVLLLPYLAALVPQALRDLGLLPNSFLTSHFWELSVILQVPMIAIVLVREVKRHREQLAQVRAEESAQRRFLSVMAHELRSPVAVIDAAVSNLEIRFTKEQGEENLLRFRRIRTALRRLNSLMDNALAESRREKMLDSLRIETMDIRELMEEVLELVSFDPDKHRVRVDIADDLGPVRFDRQWMGLALTNLLDNAVKYSPEGGEIELHVCRKDGALEIRISDQGIGMNAEEHELVFDRFYRTDTARKLPGVTGVGLGLSLTRDIVQAHHGQIRILSAPGQGTSIIMRLPGA